MIPRKLKICKGPCGKPKVLYAHGMCAYCYSQQIKKRIRTNVKASEHKKKDYRLSQTYAFEKAYYMWEGKNFLTGERIPKDEVCFDNLAHVLSKKQHEWFRFYTRNIVLLTREQHTLFDNITETSLAKRLKEFPQENWEKLFNYSYALLSEYTEWTQSNPGEYKI